MNIILWILTTTLLLVSFFKDKKKTLIALKKAYGKMISMAALFFFVMALFSLAIAFLPPELLNSYIGKESGLKGVLIALGFGSISVMPGFVAFPLGATLKMQGVPYYIIGAFTISLMTVGIATFPLEKKFLGSKVAMIRNILSLIVSIIAAIIIKIVFGE
jgi:uncharacterized membrane protein YraQ (UPF0718 family)